VSVRTFLLCVILVQGTLIVLDLVDRRVTREQRDDGESLGPEGIGFLLLVLAVFLALQFGGLALVPGGAELLSGVRSSFARWLSIPADAGTAPAWVLGLVAVFAFYVAGLFDYLLHRFFSHSRWFFFTHEYHHLPSQVFVTVPGVAGRPFAVLTVFPVVLATILTTYGTLALFGLPLWDLTSLMVVVLAQTIVNTANHSCFLRRFGWIHRLCRLVAITSPQEHVLHHTVDLQGNYGNFTTLWDRLFGTYLDPTLEKHQGHRLGLAYDQDFLGTLTLGRLKLPAHLRRRWQVARYCNIEVDGREEKDRAG